MGLAYASVNKNSTIDSVKGFFLTGGFQFVNGVFGNDLRVEQRFVDIGRIPKAVGDIDCTDSLTEMQKFIVKKGFFFYKCGRNSVHQCNFPNIIDSIFYHKNLVGSFHKS